MSKTYPTVKPMPRSNQPRYPFTESKDEKEVWKELVENEGIRKLTHLFAPRANIEPWQSLSGVKVHR
jgi:hypothetical protein